MIKRKSLNAVNIFILNIFFMSRSLGLAKVTLKIIHIIEVAISFW